MEIEPRIQRRTVLCQELFQRCADAYPADQWFENRQADFQLWSSGVGASIVGKASLDYRVRGHPETRNAICDYLDGLTELIQRHLPSTHDESDSTDSGDTDDAGDFDLDGASFNETRIAAKSILHALVRISSAIRRAGTSFRFKAADDSLDENKLYQVKRLCSLYIFRDQGPRRQLPTETWSEESDKSGPSAKQISDIALSFGWMTTVQHRLVRANLLRHNRMLCSIEAMRNKSSKKINKGFFQNPTPRTRVISEQSPEDDPRRPIPEISNKDSTQVAESSKTHTPSTMHTATDVGSQYDEKAALRRTVSSVFTQGTRTGNSLEYPSCPKPTVGGVIQCPYCGDILTEDYYVNKSRWRGHVAQDLLPYSCVVEDCSRADEMYGTSAELSNHLHKEHHVKRWTCQHCNSLAAAQNAQLFESEDKWKEHMSETHVDAFQSQQLVLFSKLAVRNILPELLCPLCQSSGEVATSNLEHVVQCLHRFALSALPSILSYQQDSESELGSSSRGAVALSETSQGSLEDLAQSMQDLESFRTGSGKLKEWGSQVTKLDRRGSRDLTTKITSKTLQEVPFSLAVDNITAWKDAIHIEEEVIESRTRPASNDITTISDLNSTDSESSDEQSSDEQADSLANQMVMNLVRSAFDKVDFLPEGFIDNHITRDTVVKELEFEDFQRELNAQDLVDFIYHEAKKVFAICLWVGLKEGDLQRAMSQFRRLGFHDISLPLTDETVKEVSFFGPRGSPPTKPWNRMLVFNFLRYQWQFLAPVFSLHRYELDLHSNHVLPFVSIGSEHWGALSRIYEATMHPSHYKYPASEVGPQIYKVALKQLKFTPESQVEREWQREITINQAIRGIDHPNIVQFMAAITRGDSRYLMYEWANGGNLRELWQRYPHPVLSRRLIKDIVQQLRGLAAALDTLHNYRGGSFRHGDLKPENILRFQRASKADSELDIGLLKLSGFSLARHHTESTQVRPPTSMRLTTHRYEPPETVTIFNRGRSRKYDIWSIGCIMLEMIVWILYGYEELMKLGESIAGDFGETGSYYIVMEKDEQREAQIHPAVDATINGLRQDQECSTSTAVGDLLELVRTKLLVVNLTKRLKASHLGQMSQIASRAGPAIVVNDSTTSEQQASNSSTEELAVRSTATELLNALDEIISMGNEDELYWYTGKSRDHIKHLQIFPGRSEALAKKTESRGLSPLVPKALSPVGTAAESIIAGSSNKSVGQIDVSLGDQLLNSLVQTRDGKGFWPRNTLQTVLREERVWGELKKSFVNFDQDQIAQIARKICETVETPEEFVDESSNQRLRSFRKIFAILVIIDKTREVIKFLEEDVNDSNLPLIKVLRSEASSRFELRIHQFPQVPLKCFASWNQIAVANFEDWQWRTLAPFFSSTGDRKDVLHYVLQDQTILPFIQGAEQIQSSTVEVEGGFGSVSKVVVHSQHHNFQSREESTGGTVAIKRLHSRDRESFKKEVEILKKFSNAHQHLISLLATYEQSNTYYLIFPWAEADLSRYWREISPSPSFEQKTVSWVAEQCRGIANGLDKIHRYNSYPSLRSLLLEREQLFGHHGDIKPENVLWFPGTSSDTLGTLKLSDFGQAELVNKNIAALENSQHNLAMSPTYRAPELDLHGFGAIGRSCDMWSLGCLYLEFATWLLGGWDLVDEFKFKRLSLDPMWSDVTTDTFFQLTKQVGGKTTAIVKPAVSKFIKRLHSHPSCSMFLHEFLEMIELDLLIIRPTDPREGGRRTCMEIEMKLSQMINHCRASVDFEINPAPWNEETN